MAEHHLNILPESHPMKQKKRHFGPEKEKFIDVQVKDLLQAGNIREIQFSTWFSNVVLVPKSTGKWRMCVDFRELNKACPKDHYPLPRIDQLKNAETTYQRLMNKVFEKQLCRNVEVYVDDIFGKSKKVADFISDLEETFATLMCYGIKLDPAKCIFGVKSGKFLGFIVTDRGIKVNQEKVKSVLSMPSPRSVKEVKKLTGMIASLSRFISRSAHRSYPFFPVLRKARHFGWNEKCEQAFRDLKSHLAELPVLVKPDPGEKLFVYLSTTEYAVSSVLIKEEGYDQKLVYYVSHALRGPELRYSEEDYDSLKGIRTDDQVESGVGEYDIEYKPRVAIKAHALSDFLSEMVQPDEEEIGALKNIPQDENGEADALAKMVASLSEVSTREILQVSWLVLSTEEETLLTLDDSWMTPLIKFIISKELPEDKAQAQKIKREAHMFVLLNNVLHRRSFHGPLFKCLSSVEVDYVLQEIHEGCCGEHLRGVALARKTMLAGFWWPTITQNSARVVLACEEVVNKIILQASKTRLHDKRKEWVEELPSVLWAYRTTLRTPTQETPFYLVYGSEAVLPVGIGQTSARVESYPRDNDQIRAIELDFVEEKRQRALIRMEAYRGRVMKSYNKKVRIRDFQVGDLVMKKVNQAGDVGKLEARWEGPYRITRKI
ncbi:uncharacterized protein [Primulina huaijiensis]|uniref:uncharacterized protein n=1 Tax=Primulina huaijiensis TaxID=1492673 RepID=UPI003CC73FBF